MDQGLLAKASAFVRQAYKELGIDGSDERIRMIHKEITEKGTYAHLDFELEHGARMAWRNSNRCIGRLFWRSLAVHDHRELSRGAEVFKALEHHLQFATNQGKIKPTISVFAPQGPDGSAPVRILNTHLIRYADDPEQSNFLSFCKTLGWNCSDRAQELLPMVIQCNGDTPEWKIIPPSLVLEVELSHPSYPWFSQLSLKWHAVPLMSDMTLEIGGILYPCAPFNGWYMVTEIGARNLGDEHRYNVLPLIAERMGLDQKQDPFWKDKALVILNEAVFLSFRNAGVTITDHHSASEQFMKFVRNEEAEGRKVNAEWAWIVPPMSASTTRVFHREYTTEIISPNFFHNEIPVTSTCPFHKKAGGALPYPE